MSNKVSLDGIIAYALVKKMNGGSNSSSVRSVKFDNEKLTIVTTDNTIFEAPFPEQLKHDNKNILDKITIDNNNLVYDGKLICDFSETVKNIILDDKSNELIITFGNNNISKIPLEPIILDVVNEILANSGKTGSMFLFGSIASEEEFKNVINPKEGQTIIVENDGTKANQRSLYIYKDKEWLWVGSISLNRDFSKQPINLNTEVTGSIIDSMVPNSIARVSQLHNHDNKNILDNLSENNSNELLYKGKKISSINLTDKDNTIFENITSLKIGNFLGQLKEGLLELNFEGKSTDLNDMPKLHSEGKVLVSNQKNDIYELKSIEEITDLKENYTATIRQEDWGNNDGLGYYKKIITHNLNSSNLIVAFYDTNNNVKIYEYSILNDLEIEIKSDNNNECRVVINCSQGTAKKNDFGDSNLDHTHSNLSILNGFDEDTNGNLLYNGSRIFTNFNPLTYKENWRQESSESLKLLVDYNTIFEEQDIKVLTNSEIVIKNENILTGEKDIDENNKLHIKIIEDDFLVLDVFIRPEETQKYITGINPNTQIYIKGYFSGSLVINYFDVTSIQSGTDLLKNYYNKNEINILLVEKQNKIDNDLSTVSKTVVDAINEVNDKVNNSKLEINAGNGVNIYDNTISLKVDGTSVMFDENGRLKAQLNIGSDEGNINIKQYILKDIKSGTLYTIEDENLPINHKMIPCVLALENSKQATTSITDFKLDIEDISSDNHIKIQNSYYLDINEESPIINKSSFNKILEFRGGA